MKCVRPNRVLTLSILLKKTIHKALCKTNNFLWNTEHAVCFPIFLCITPKFSIIACGWQTRMNSGLGPVFHIVFYYDYFDDK